MIELSVKQDGETIPYMSNFQMSKGEAIPIHVSAKRPRHHQSLPLPELAKYKTMCAIASTKFGDDQGASKQLAASRCIDKLIEAVDGERTQA